MQPLKVLFVCLGNICRSPLAEGLFRNEVEKAGLADHFYIDSAGTSSYHIGETPDRRTTRNAASYGINLSHKARQITSQDLEDFDHIIVMDRQNYRDVCKLDESGVFRPKIELFRNFDKSDTETEVPDPWFGGDEGFDVVFHIIRLSSAALFEEIRQKL